MPQAGAMAVFKLDDKSFKNSVDQLNKKFKILSLVGRLGQASLHISKGLLSFYPCNYRNWFSLCHNVNMNLFCFLAKRSTLKESLMRVQYSTAAPQSDLCCKEIFLQN